MPALQYWRITRQRLAQRFYIALCLLVASVQDGFLGSRERRGGNLNWSATISYYSLVHTGRLLLFLSVGDFPRSHDRLKRFLEGRSQETASAGRYPFDWLMRFSRESGAVFARPEDEGPLGWHLFPIVSEYLYELMGPDAPQRLERLGQVFVRAKGLRNDANYEALLIAHEQQHRITPAFESLADAMSRAAMETALPLAREAFAAFLARDPDMRADEEQYRAFLDDHVGRFLEPDLRSKLAPDEELPGVLQAYLEPFRAGEGGVEHAELSHNISEGIFEGKGSLMRGFEEDIATFDELVRQP